MVENISPELRGDVLGTKRAVSSWHDNALAAHSQGSTGTISRTVTDMIFDLAAAGR
jgi:hypothetical protein